MNFEEQINHILSWKVDRSVKILPAYFCLRFSLGPFLDSFHSLKQLLARFFFHRSSNHLIYSSDNLKNYYPISNPSRPPSSDSMTLLNIPRKDPNFDLRKSIQLFIHHKGNNVEKLVFIYLSPNVCLF